ncbi:dimeric dUTPase (all-alpha-NTP-PPase superfamily) [Pullulanibacillus pueri]|uniref:dUTPase n=1 Tax=Pullulanibacillus pueri TaxID=1437324 RepID=A0A8J3EP96_9BACL|nr:dUTP diphosphatase [Pullulanibacillus pueri]MBM7682030.1 dimeric dUTPase (all-alpha-NTP-PPase superfamily) [Pullulanibacillus pueri]GGH88273.1 hypothetical protein GCM10007096_40230 [Pullulanibacillus pueri]
MSWLNALYHVQQQLDHHIQSQHGLLGHNLIEEKTLAFLVELGELANETRCFKFWSVKPASSQDIILEEYVDGIHFLLSLGIDLGFTDVSAIEDVEVEAEQTATAQFLTVYQLATLFKEDTSYEQYLALFAEFLKLGAVLGFDAAAIKESYFKKNEVNYKRQQEKY